MSSNLISRSTVNAFTKSFLLQLILDTQYEYLGSFLSYIENFSPHTYIEYYTCCVYPFGDVNGNDYDIGYSYGYAGHALGR